MATPFVVQTVQTLGRTCTTQEYTDCFGKGLKHHNRPHHEHSNQCCIPYNSSWCPDCEHGGSAAGKSCSTGRRRSKSEGMDRDRSQNYYHTRKSLLDECDKQFCQTIREYNLRSGTNYHDRLRGKPCRRYNHCEFPECAEESERSSLAAYPLVDRIEPAPPQHSSVKSGNTSCRQFLASCENNVELRNRSIYFSKKCNTEQSRSSAWKGGRLDNYVHKEDDRYIQEVERLRSKLRELKEGTQEGKRLRQTSESDLAVASGHDAGTTKRPRDISPQIRPFLSTMDEPVNPAMLVPRIPRPNIPSSEEVTSISSDSDFADSACDEEDVKDDEPDIGIEESVKPELSSTTLSSIEIRCSPSRVVGDSLESISLNDKLSSTMKQVLSAGHSGDGVHPGLRASLFSYVPPYIRFSTHDIKAAVLPTQIQNLLKWKLSRITPIIVRRTIVNSGYKIVRKSNEWSGTWGKHMKSICFKTIREYQKMNHFPGSFQIGRKDHLWKNLVRLMVKYGRKEFGFMPRTFILPQDNKLLRAVWEKHCGKERWIVKPPASARGTGIKVIHKWAQIPKKCPLIVQKYITEPYLINGSKFDLRLYALVASVNPLRVYLYDNGLVRFASVKYSSELSTLVDRYMHLTNYSINKQSSQYTDNEDAGACQGHKWTLHALWKYLEKEKGVNVQQLWARMVDLVIKTVISGEASMTQLSRAHLTSRYCAYELFGIDILLGEDLKPWLLEVNISPSLHSTTPLDTAVKGPLVRDILNIAGYQIPNKLSNVQQESLVSKLGVDGVFCYDRRLYTTVLSPAERGKHTEYQQMESREDYLDCILEDLTPDDVRHLIQYEDEVTQIGNFQKIFPTERTHVYLEFFESPRYYNMLFDAWETHYHSNRSKGIQVLEALCVQHVHLEVNYAQQKRAKARRKKWGTLLTAWRNKANPMRTVVHQMVADKASTSHTQAHLAAQAAPGAPVEEEEEEVNEKESPPPVQSLDTTSKLPTADKPREKWSVTPTAICRAARTRSGKPGVVTKPFPRSCYITRRSPQSKTKAAHSPS